MPICKQWVKYENMKKECLIAQWRIHAHMPVVGQRPRNFVLTNELRFSCKSASTMFFLFIQNNKLQTQIQLQTWIDKKHKTGRNPLGCQKHVTYPVGLINVNTNSDRW